MPCPPQAIVPVLQGLIGRPASGRVDERNQEEVGRNEKKLDEEVAGEELGKLGPIEEVGNFLVGNWYENTRKSWETGLMNADFDEPKRFCEEAKWQGRKSESSEKVYCGTMQWHLRRYYALAYDASPGQVVVAAAGSVFAKPCLFHEMSIFQEPIWFRIFHIVLKLFAFRPLQLTMCAVSDEECDFQVTSCSGKCPEIFQEVS